MNTYDRTRPQLSRVPGECLVEVLETTAVLLLAACLVFVWARFSLFEMRTPLFGGEVSAFTPAASNEEQPLKADPLQVSPAGSRANASERFNIRVGSFTDPLNARRVGESLQQQGFNVRTDVLADD